MAHFKLFLIAMMGISASEKARHSWYLPISVQNRQSWEQVQLTHIGGYGLLRVARPGVPAHLHTAMDFARPSENYVDEPIFPAAAGVVISQRTDGPFAQVIIAHRTFGTDSVWTVYEHIAGVNIVVGDTVTPLRPIGRFMTRDELNRYGWQFDHLHFEILRHRPRPHQPIASTPMRLFKPYNLECYDREDLDRYYYDPQQFFARQWGIGVGDGEAE